MFFVIKNYSWLWRINSTLSCCIIHCCNLCAVAGFSSCDYRMESHLLFLSKLVRHKPLLASCYKLLPSLGASLTCFWDLFSSHLSCLCIPASDRSPALTLMTAILLGTVSCSPVVKVANFCQEWSLQEPISPNHRQAFCEGLMPPLREHRHTYLLLRARQRKGQVLCFSGPWHIYS